MTFFVLVHGAWHSSAQWAATQRELARLGADSLALDLPGHGLTAPHPTGYLTPGQPGLATEKSALADLTVDELTETVLDALRTVRRHDHVALVGHSAGGVPITQAAELAPDLVDHLVYLSAYVPSHPTFRELLAVPEQTEADHAPLAVGDPGELGAFRINPASPDPHYVEQLRAEFYQDIPANQFDRWRLALSPDFPSAIPATPVEATPERWGRVPRSYIRLAEDRAITAAAQDRAIRETDEAFPDRQFRVLTLPGSHSPFAARPAELAAALLAAIQ